MTNLRTPYTETPVFTHKSAIDQACFLAGRMILKSDWDHDRNLPTSVEEPEWSDDQLEYHLIMMEGARALAISETMPHSAEDLYELYAWHKIRARG